MRKRIFVVAGVVIVAVFLSTAGLGLVNYFQNKGKLTSSVKIDNVNPAVVKKITSQLVYGSGKSDIGSYYSPSLDALITYPVDKFEFDEFDTNLLISTRSQNRFSSVLNNSISVYKILDTETKGQTIAEWAVGSLKQNKSNVSTELLENGQQGNLAKFKIKTIDKSILKKNENVEKVNVFYSKKINGGYYLAKISYLPGFESENLEKDISGLLETGIKPAPADLPQTIQILLEPYANETGAKLELDIDRKKWSVPATQSSDTQLAMDFRKDAEAGKKCCSTFRVDFDNYYGQQDPTEGDVLKELTNIEDIHRGGLYKDSYKSLQTNKKVEILGRAFYENTRQFRHDDGDIFYEATYYGYVKELKAYLKIEISTNSFESSAFSESQKIINNIKLNNGPVSSNRNSGLVAQKVLGATSGETLEVDKTSILGRNSILHIFNRSCVFTQIVSMPEDTSLNGKQYKICMAGEGSGFYVNKDGYVITNAHVARQQPEDIIFQAASYGLDNGFFKDYMNGFLKAFSSIEELQQKYASEEEFQIAFFERFVNDFDKGAIKLVPQYENYIEMDQPFEFDYEALDLKSKQNYLKAEVVDSSIDSYIRTTYDSIQEVKKGKKLDEINTGIKYPDLALLKVEIDSSKYRAYPALQLEDSNKISVGQTIQAIGFPGAADNKGLFSKQASSIPTLTKGTISAIKPNTNNNFNLIQIDASISHGNSGGPVLDNSGRVIGVATYGISGSEAGAADFNAAISSEAVSKFIQKNNIKNDPGEATAFLVSGLNNFMKYYFSSAIKDFTRSKDVYNSKYDLINPLVEVSKEKIAQGEDKSPMLIIGSLELKKSDVILITVIAIVVLLLMVLGLLVILLRSHKKLANNVNNMNNQPQPLPQTPPAPPTQQNNPPGVA